MLPKKFEAKQKLNKGIDTIQVNSNNAFSVEGGYSSSILQRRKAIGVDLVHEWPVDRRNEAR
jgi:hypothetical protein